MRFRSRLILAASLLVCLPGAVLRGSGQEGQPSEYQLKAAFLYNFAKFADWPTNSFPQSASPFVIGVIGPNPFGEDLQQVIKGKKIGTHPCEVRTLSSLTELKKCHILFISASERRRMPEILENLQGANVLTVSDMERFLPSGGMIQFVMKENKVRFAINDEAARKAGIRLSSKLLNLALSKQ